MYISVKYEQDIVMTNIWNIRATVNLTVVNSIPTQLNHVGNISGTGIIEREGPQVSLTLTPHNSSHE